MSESLTQGGVHRGKGEGRAFWLLTDLLVFKLVGDDTNGALTVLELTGLPELGPPPHVHRHCDESFYILEGTYDFTLAGQAFSAGAGSFVYLPKGVLHSHRPGRGGRGKALVMQSPAGVERFIEEAGTPATDLSAQPGLPDPSAVERVLKLAEKHAIDVPQG